MKYGVRYGDCIIADVRQVESTNGYRKGWTDVWLKVNFKDGTSDDFDCGKGGWDYAKAFARAIQEKIEELEK